MGTGPSNEAVSHHLQLQEIWPVGESQCTIIQPPVRVNQGVTAANVVRAPEEGCSAGTELLTLIFLLFPYLQHIPSTLPAICFLMVK